MPWTQWQKAAFIMFMSGMAIVMMLIGAALAQANGTHTLTVDGTVYAPSKVVGSGPTVHYFTPGATPSVAFTERHTWTGNGSDNLPCEGLLHWIDNKNVLTISHCEFENGTTTTTTQVTTTTSPEVTTTTRVVSTTTSTTSTTQPTTTTTAPTTSTTVVGSTTTTTTGDASTTTTTVRDGSTTSTNLTLCGKDGDAPCGGVSTGGGSCIIGVCTVAQTSGSGWGWVWAGVSLLALGLATLVGGLLHSWWTRDARSYGRDNLNRGE